MNAPAARRDDKSPDRFATTRWSVVLSCADSQMSEKAQESLAYLCRVYWRPVLAFICRQGVDSNDAQDLTQEFFVKVLGGDLLKVADPARGRFRSLLLKALQNFLRDAHEKKSTKKRGGDVQFVSWDDWMAEAPSQLSLPLQALESWPPERLFDVRWAATVVEQALRRLREECEARGRRRVFDAVSGYLATDEAAASYADTAKSLGVAVATLKPIVHRLRQRYRELLREEVAETVENESDVDEEIRYLCATLSALPA